MRERAQIEPRLGLFRDQHLPLNTVLEVTNAQVARAGAARHPVDIARRRPPGKRSFNLRDCLHNQWLPANWPGRVPKYLDPRRAPRRGPRTGVLSWLGNAPFGFAISPAGCLILDSIVRGRWARSSTKTYPQATFRIPGRHFGEEAPAGGQKPSRCAERIQLRVKDTAVGFRRRDADGCDRDGRAPLFVP